jgi:hypothetical protein
MKKESIRSARKRQRESAREQGFYDGRFRTRVVTDKKKEAEKRKCRGKMRYFNK